MVGKSQKKTVQFNQSARERSPILGCKSQNIKERQPTPYALRSSSKVSLGSSSLQPEEFSAGKQDINLNRRATSCGLPEYSETGQSEDTTSMQMSSVLQFNEMPTGKVETPLPQCKRSFTLVSMSTKDKHEKPNSAKITYSRKNESAKATERSGLLPKNAVIGDFNFAKSPNLLLQKSRINSISNSANSVCSASRKNWKVASLKNLDNDGKENKDKSLLSTPSTKPGVHAFGTTPNFKAIHMKAFSRMESIYDCYAKRNLIKVNMTSIDRNCKLGKKRNIESATNCQVIKKAGFSQQNKSGKAVRTRAVKKVTVPLNPVPNSGKSAATSGRPSVHVTNKSNVNANHLHTVTSKGCCSKFNGKKKLTKSVPEFVAKKENRVKKVKFDVKASLKRKLNYRPYTGPLKPFEELGNSTFYHMAQL